MVGRLVMESYERLLIFMECTLMKAGDPTDGIFFKITDQQPVKVMQEVVYIQQGVMYYIGPIFKWSGLRTFVLVGTFSSVL